MNAFVCLSPGRTPASAWARLHHDIQYGQMHGTRHDPHGAAIVARNGDLRGFAYPVGVYVPRNQGTIDFVQWVQHTGVNLGPDPEIADIADVELAALVRGQAHLLATALAMHSLVQSPDSPVGYIELPEPGPGDDPDQPQFAEAARYHAVLGYSRQRLYVFFGWVDAAESTVRSSAWI
ncbi:MAG: hypothetical protein KKA73_15530 [Chloroflexi bacterium]|nr:hypothetical protein [Chloroflexota bacterium]MBU1749096.1 hypothetical protein [Chloroflexota bacterium]